jgi:hypothetical protein
MGFELWTYTLSYSTSLFFFWWVFFQIGSQKLFTWVGFQLRSSWFLPPESRITRHEPLMLGLFVCLFLRLGLAM